MSNPPQNEDLGTLLNYIWTAQAKHNILVKRVEERTHEEWIQTYLQGMQSEISELLDEINWKVHRKSRTDWDSVGALIELADITKYVFSLWIHLGISPKEALQYVQTKSEIVEHRFWHEWKDLPRDKLIIISDLDGTLADWRTGFSEWATANNVLSKSDVIKTMNLDLDMGWSYTDYASAKAQFEYSGGHLTLPPFADGIQFVHEAQEIGALLYIVTARPTKPSRNFYDTYGWCKACELAPEWVYLMGDQRIALACKLAQHNTVIALEDNPDLARRYAANGILTIVRVFPYNTTLVTDYPEHLILTDNFVQSAMKDPRLSSLTLSRRWHREKA